MLAENKQRKQNGRLRGLLGMMQRSLPKERERNN